MPILTTSATRLLEVVSSIKSIDNQMLLRPGLPAWAKVFEVEPSDINGLYRKLAMTGNLPSEVSTDFRNLPEIDHDLHLSWVANATAALNPTDINAQLKRAADTFNSEVVNLIRICESHLIRHSPEEAIDVDEMATLRASATSLADDVLADEELSSDLKQYILHHTHLVIQAIDDYGLQGASAILNGVDATIGAMVRQKASAKRTQETPYGERLQDTLKAFVVVVAAWKGAKEIGGDFGDILKTGASILQLDDEGQTDASAE